VTEPFERLHPAVQHHVVNSLGWASLRPLQSLSIEPVLAGDHALLLAPTAQGKTEAAFLPLLSRMLTEEWKGLSVLYVCPLRALLNNLHPRLERYAGFVGRRAGLWHGDVADSVRRRILSDPPDVLLTTPESIEVMLTSRRVDRPWLFGNLRAVVIDELHAFAGDDRGWHLLSVLERVARFAGRDVQRVGLSATIGNPEALLEWLAGSSGGSRRVVAAPQCPAADADVRVDHVGSIENAAHVISRLHPDEKRLVFCDSRSRVEDLTYALREAGVEAWASHSSLSAAERRQAEATFAEGGSSVIVATSTLELGIDIGDLDRVIQVDAPGAVSSFLQRMGRTGRRPGTRRNYLFLTTSRDSHLLACGLVKLWARGFVEPVVPPPSPVHILAQQILALTLQNGGLARGGWREWVEGMPGFRALADPNYTILDLTPRSPVCSAGERIEGHLVETGFLFDDEGVLSFGPESEASFGGRKFLELLSVFSSDPLFSVRYGSEDVGRVDPATFQLARERAAVLLLGGRPWRVTGLDWKERIAYVEPAQEEGRSLWLGSGAPLSFAVCQAIRDVLVDPSSVPGLTRRGTEALRSAVDFFPALASEATTLVQEAPEKVRWWTFAGLRANATLTERLAKQGLSVTSRDNFGITLREGSTAAVSVALEKLRSTSVDPAPASLVAEALDGLKFAECVPKDLATAMLRARLADPVGVSGVLARPAVAAEVPSPLPPPPYSIP
jgi:ATP-dependent Lhr-like helicase